MKHLTYLLLWLSVLTFGHAAHAVEAGFLTATPTTAALPVPASVTNAPIGKQETPNSELPPPPPETASPEDSPPETALADPDRSIAPQPQSHNGGTLDFALSPTSASPTSASPTSASPAPLPPTSSASPAPASPAATLTASPALDGLFAGNENSLVAKAVGSAEGTRTPDGGRNPAYYGHVDPGNGVWNLGSFSYQHVANSPEDADVKQLARLRRQADQILQKASDKGLALTITEKLNGIDLANQAPLAALGRQGYVDWLAVAKSEGKPEADAVLSARVRSFINPKTQQWDAPGLGNSEAKITRDQERRMQAIERAILANQQQIAQMTQTATGEEQLLSQKGDSLFTGVMPALQENLPEQGTAEKTIAEAPNTDSIIGFNPL